MRRTAILALVAIWVLGITAPSALSAVTKPKPQPKPTVQTPPKPPPQKEEDKFVVWANDVGWMHLGTVREFSNPGPHSSETWGGLSDEPLKNAQLLGPFATKEQAMEALEKAVAEVEEGYSPLAFPKTYLIAKIGGQEYKLGSEIKLKRVPIARFNPRYLIHCTRTYTMNGPRERDDYVLHHEPPKDGRFQTADGYGGIFHNEGTLVGGPYKTNYELCPVLKGLKLKGIWLGDRYISCEDPWWETAPPPSPTPPQQAPPPSTGEATEGTEEQPAEQQPPQQRPRTGPDYEDRSQQLRWLSTISDAIADADHEAKMLLAKLGIQRLAAAKIRAKIDLLQSAIAEGDYTDDMRDRLKERVQELREQLAEIYKEQDEAIRKVFDYYDHLIAELQKEHQKSKWDDVKETIEALRRELEQKRDLANLELYLASGQRDKFHSLARDYLAAGKYVDVVRLAQAMDFVENRDPGSALYALRMALDENPGNTGALQMLQALEVGYLKAIDDKSMGEAATVRAACWEALKAHGEPGFFAYLKDLFTTGITTSVSAIGGKPQSLADLAAAMQDEASVQHAGLLLLMRLREKGLTFNQVRALDNQALIARIKGLFGQDIADEQALRMRFAIQIAFRNSDVDRLMRPSKEQFDVDRGISYFNSEEFDPTWQDWIGDAVNVKNVMLMLGPSAVVKVGGKFAGSGLMTAKELEAGLTVKDAFATMIRLPELADALGKTKVGRACIDELLKFEQSTGIVSKVLAEALVQQGIVEVGKAVGGPAGELAAEVLTALGVGDIDLAVKILKQNGVKQEAIDAIAGRLRNVAQQADEVRVPSKQYLDQVDNVLKDMSGGKSVSDAARRSLKDSSDEVQEKVVTLVRRVNEGDASRVMLEEAEKLKTLKRTLDSAADGNQADAEAGRKLVRELDDKTDDAVRQIKQQDEVVQNLTTKVKQADQPGMNPPAGGTNPPADSLPRLTTKAPAQKPKPMQEVIHDSGLESPSVPKATQTPDEIKQEAERLKGIKYADGGVTSHADDAMRRGDYDEAARRYKQLLAGAGLDDNAAEEVAEKLRIANQTKEAADRLKAPDEAARARALKDFSEEEVQKIARTPADRIKPLTTSAGETSLTSPRVLFDENGIPIAVFKPTLPGKRPNNLDVKGEQIASRLAQKMGVNTPAVAPITMNIDGRQQSGVLVRFVENRSDLTVLDAGMQRAVKQEVAKDKVMSVFLGDHDRHAGNYFVTRDGNVFNIDHGWAEVVEPNHMVNWDGPIDKLRADIPKIMDYRAQLPGTGDPIIQGIDNQIHFDDVEPAIRKIEQMTDDDIRALVRGIYDPGTEADRAVQTLLTRRDNLRGVFEKRFPRMGPVQPGALHWPRSRWWAGLWPRWQWQPAMALHPAG